MGMRSLSRLIRLSFPVKPLGVQIVDVFQVDANLLTGVSPSGARKFVSPGKWL